MLAETADIGLTFFNPAFPHLLPEDRRLTCLTFNPNCTFSLPSAVPIVPLDGLS